MIVQIRGVNFVNKGAELMMHAVVQQISSTYEEGIVAARLDVGTFQQRTQAGLYHLVVRDSKKFPPLRPIIDTLTRLIPRRVRRLSRLVSNTEVQAVLDASGLAYTDHFGPSASEYMAEESQIWKKEGKKVVLLPQAFGPFENPQTKKAILQILANVDLVFARDRVSYDHLTGLGGCTSHIKIAPDFTNLVKGRIPKYFDSASPQPCIIPNYKMMDKTPEDVRSRYLLSLARCAEYLLQKGEEPFVLVHETATDQELARQLQAELGRSIKIMVEPDPLYIKGILGNCSMVISSRFHGLVSALSQGVPSLGTGWSHKYQLLFEDYACPECLISPLASDEIIFHKISMLISEPSRSDIIRRLNQAGLKQKQLATDMWAEVHKLLQS
jgi:polysaccharide pyruvyl transferase WcaK-like protein